MTDMHKIVLVEDEASLAETVAFNLREEGYDVITVADGAQALDVIMRERPDLVLLDVMLPGMDGLEVCRRLRRQSDEVPVIMLTARAREIDKVVGLEVGADDYVTKPFGMMELVARVRAALRRARRNEADQEILRGLGLEMNTAKHEVRVNDRIVELRPKEFDLLHILLANRGRVLDRSTLLDRVWGEDEYIDQGTLDVHVRRLREKIEDDPGSPKRVVTVRGVGYKFAE